MFCQSLNLARIHHSFQRAVNFLYKIFPLAETRQSTINHSSILSSSTETITNPVKYTVVKLYPEVKYWPNTGQKHGQKPCFVSTY